MEILRILAGPIIGAAIGYITNDIAIRMLFRPHRPIYVAGRRLPFTPGIVPRRKDQLAKTLGDAIVAKFFNADDLEIIFTTGIADSVADAIVDVIHSDITVSDLKGQLSDETLDKMEKELCVRLQASFCMSDLPEVFAEEGSKMAANILSSGGAGQLIAAGIGESVSKPLAHEIREFVIERGQECFLPLIRSELERASDLKVSDVIGQFSDKTDEELHQVIRDLYLKFMSVHVRPIVESIDVGGMITEKIVLMTSEEVEDLVLTVVRRELHLVVLFGAFIGALIGTVNIFI